jgi:hypothetical protein
MISIKSRWLGHDTPDIEIILTHPLLFNGPLKFLSILNQTHSNFTFY